MKLCWSCGLRRPLVNGKKCEPCTVRVDDYASDALVTLDAVAAELGVSMQRAARDRLGLRLEDLVP